MGEQVNTVCWLPKVALGTDASSSPNAAPAAPAKPADTAMWSVTVHPDFIEGTTSGGTAGKSSGGTMGARFDRRTRQTTTTSDLRVFGFGPGPVQKPGGIAQLRRAVEACAERERGTAKEAALRDAARELAAADPGSANPTTRKP